MGKFRTLHSEGEGEGGSDGNGEMKTRMEKIEEGRKQALFGRGPHICTKRQRHGSDRFAMAMAMG